MNQGIRTVIYPVKDIAQAKTLYSKLLGVEPYADEAYYVGFKVGDQEIGFGSQWPQRRNDRTRRLLSRERHQEKSAIAPGRWRTSTARGQRCRWGEADCMGQRRRQ